MLSTSCLLNFMGEDPMSSNEPIAGPIEPGFAAMDPVCGMRVHPEKAKASTEYQGKTHYFCCPSCQQRFQAEPEKYLARAAAAKPVPAPMTPLNGSPAPMATMEVDPVCGMRVHPEEAKGSTEYQGATYSFCSPRCQERFQAEPEKYLAAKPAAPTATEHHAAHGKAVHPEKRAAGERSVAYICPMCPEVRETKPVPCRICGMALEPEVLETVTYTCPMHPEVVSDRPGDCPKCGMALESRVMAAHQPEDDSELRFMQRRLWIGAALSAPLLLTSMGAMAGGLLGNLSHRGLEWLQAA